MVINIFFISLNNHSRFNCVILCKFKTEVPNVVKKIYITMIETCYNSRVKIVRSDNGFEFLTIRSMHSKEWNIKLVLLRLSNKMVVLKKSVNIF